MKITIEWLSTAVRLHVASEMVMPLEGLRALGAGESALVRVGEFVFGQRTLITELFPALRANGSYGLGADLFPPAARLRLVLVGVRVGDIDVGGCGGDLLIWMRIGVLAGWAVLFGLLVAVDA